MTTDIFISNVAEYVPTVNQLERTAAHIGYNRVDAKLYGLKIVGGVKSVVAIGGDVLGTLPDDYISGVTDGVWDLGVDSGGSLQVSPYAAKKGSDPGYPYFFSGTASSPSYTNRLNLDGALYLTQIYGSTSGITAEFRSSLNTALKTISFPGLAAEFIAWPTSTNTIVNAARLTRFSSSTPTAGIGGALSFAVARSTSLAPEAGQFACKWTDITENLEDSAFEWYLKSEGSLTRKMLLSDDGKLTLDTYGDGTHTGTATKWLAVDVNGNVIEETAPVAATQYWQRNGTILSPATAGDDISTSGSIYAGIAGFFGNYQPSYGGNYSTLQSVVLSQIGYNSIPYTEHLFGNSNTALPANTQVSSPYIFLGRFAVNSQMAKGIEILVKTGDQWSNTNYGTSYDIQSVLNNETSLYSRIKITADGYVVINEDGRPTWLRVEGDTDSHLFEVDGVNDRVGIGTGGSVDTKLHVQTQSDWAQEAVKIEQVDEDQAFIDFVGTSAANATKNISTFNGDGAVEGPKAAVAPGDGWLFTGMLKIEVNGTAYWQPIYSHVDNT